MVLFRQNAVFAAAFWGEVGTMSRKRSTHDSRPVRVVELYGKDLRWQTAEPNLRLTDETVARLTHEGYTMALVRVGLWRTRRVSLIRHAQRLS